MLHLTASGLLVPYLEITQSRKKVSYFVKRKAQTVTEVNVRELLIPGDMAPNPIEELAVLVEDVCSKPLSIGVTRFSIWHGSNSTEFCNSEILEFAKI